MKKIFISSTFRDMNEERDLFHERICPELNEIARGYGESVSFCDLRWGVDTTTLESEEGSRKVLSVCLDEIDRCRPYMVVLLGERYGWIPSSELISETVSRRQDFALDELEKSVTALEIEYGALRNSDQLERTLFYFREIEGCPSEDYSSESEHHAQKLSSLKERIAHTTGCNVKTYTVQWDDERSCICDLDVFAEMVVSDIRNLMEKEWQELAALSPYQKDLHSQWETATQKGSQFTARYDLIRSYTELIKENSCLVVRGPSGSGKSTIMSRLALDIREQGCLTLPVFCGSSSLCSTSMDILQYMTDFIETELALPHFAAPNSSLKEWQNRLDEVIKLYSKSSERELVILIDAVDQLLADDERDTLQFFPSALSEKVKIVLSCLDSFKINRDILIEDVPMLDKADRESVVRGILAPTGRGLSDEVIAAIAAKDGGDKPLYLSLLVSRLEMMDRDDFEDINRHGGSIEAINSKQIELINECSVDLDRLCVELLGIAAEKLGSDLPFTAAKYLAMSRYGLRESDLESIFRLLDMPWDALSFSRFRLYMSRFFIQRDDGRLDFAHKSFRSGFAAMSDNSTALHSVILKHFKSLPENDDIRMREIIYHCIMADDKQFFADYIANDSNDSYIEYAKENTSACVNADDGIWLDDFIKDSSVTGKSGDLYAFVLLDVIEGLPESLRTMSIKSRIYESFIAGKEDLLKTSKGRVLLDLSYYRLSNVYITLGGMENFEHAEQLMYQAMEDMEQEWEHIDEETDEFNLNNKVYILSLYSHLANLYVTMGIPEKVEKAITIMFDALEKADKLRDTKVAGILKHRYAAIYSSLASAYSRLDSKLYLKEIIGYAEKSCSIFEEILESNPSAQDYYSMISKYDNLISALSYDKNEENISRSFDLASKALAISEKLVKEEGTIEALGAYAGCLETMATPHCEIGDKENLLMAVDYIKKAVSAQEKVILENDTESAISDLASYLLREAGIYTSLDDKEYHLKARDIYDRVIEVLKPVDSGITSPVIHSLVACACLNAGEIMVNYDIERAHEYFTKAMDAFETVVSISDVETNFILLRSSYSHLAELEEQRDRYEDALGYYFKIRDLTSERMTAKDSGDWAEVLSYALTRICTICMDLEGKWLKTALENYLRRLELNKYWTSRGLILCEANVVQVIYNNVAWIYENAEDLIDFENALKYRFECCDVAKMRYDENQSLEMLLNLAKASNKVVGTYLKLCGSDKTDDLRKNAAENVSLWETLIREDLSETHLNGLVTALCYAAEAEISDDAKAEFNRRALNIAKNLYDMTGSEKYQKKITQLEKLILTE